jgi:hypothetical protein
MTFGEKLRNYLAAAKTAAPAGTWDGTAWVAAVDTFYNGTQKERKRAAVADGAEEIYNAYPKHVGRDDALKAITNALKRHPTEYLLDKTTQFAAAVASWPSSYRYKMDGCDTCPHPSTWFNQGRYADDAKEWCRKGARTAPGRPQTSNAAPTPEQEQDAEEARKRLAEGPEPKKGTLAHSCWLEARTNGLVASVTQATTEPVHQIEAEQQLRHA